MIEAMPFLERGLTVYGFYNCGLIPQVAMLRVQVVANARSDGIAGMHGGAVKIKLRAPAVDGKANAALIRFLAEHLQLPRHSIVLERGRASRDKLIRVDGLSESELRVYLPGV